MQRRILQQKKSNNFPHKEIREEVMCLTFTVRTNHFIKLNEGNTFCEE